MEETDLGGVNRRLLSFPMDKRVAEEWALTPEAVVELISAMNQAADTWKFDYKVTFGTAETWPERQAEVSTDIQATHGLLSEMKEAGAWYADSMALDLFELAKDGDRASQDAYLAVLDGAVKKGISPHTLLHMVIVGPIKVSIFALSNEDTPVLRYTMLVALNN